MFWKKKQTNDFEACLRRIHDISNDPSRTTEQIRTLVAVEINNLSEESYVANFDKIVYIIQRSKDKCAKFKNSEEQVANILTGLPRLEDHRELLLLYIQERRRKYKLEV